MFAFELEARGNEVLLTVIHRRLPDRPMLLMVAAGRQGRKSTKELNDTSH